MDMVLMLVSAGILLLLGTVHFFYTFFGPKLLPRDPVVRASMEAAAPVISKETTMWRAWIGFNASHSMGAMLFGMLYGYLAWSHSELLFGSTFLLAIGGVMLGGYVVLGRIYWFRIPFAAISVALTCYLGSIVACQF